MAVDTYDNGQLSPITSRIDYSFLESAFSRTEAIL